MTNRLYILLIIAATVAWFSFHSDDPTHSVDARSSVASSISKEKLSRVNSSMQVLRDAANKVPNAGSISPIISRRQLIAPTDSAAPNIDLFKARSWMAVPALPQPVSSKDVPQSPVIQPLPPMPFVFIGKKFESGFWEVFLSRNEQVYVVRKGQIIDGQYQILEISPPTLELRYLPLNQTQTLTIGDVY